MSHGTQDPGEQRALESFFALDAAALLASDVGILTGGGGGFVMRYQDFLIAGSGEAEVAHYTLDYGTGQVADLRSAPLLRQQQPAEFQRLLEMAVDLGFFSLQVPPPMANIVRHTAVAHPDHGLHRVVWSPSASPPKELVDFDAEVRRFLVEGFEREVG